jgi:starvation-inducible outer membrane lipoprotein
MRRTITALLAAACIALAGCSSPSPDSDEPAKPTATATPSAATTSVADQIAACTDAIAAGKDEGDGAPECTGLSVDDYMKALQAANQRGRDALSSAAADATSQP